MEEFERLKKEANRYFKTADHLVYVTYPLVKDHRLMITALENLYIAMRYAMDAVIYYDRLYKRIGPVPENFESRYEVFKMKCAPRYKIANEFVVMFKQLKRFIDEHKNSPVEFVRNNKVVICSQGYESVKMVDINLLKSYVVNVREFMRVVNSI